MNKREREILNIEQNFKDTLENEIAEQNTENRRVEIKDIKYAGQAIWKDKINGKDISELVFVVEKLIIELDEERKERITEQKSYYLGNECIGVTIGNDDIVYKEIFMNSEPDKLQAVNHLIKNVSEKDLENYSLNNLENKELAEVLSAHLGRTIKPEDVREELEDLDEEKEKQNKNEKNKDENDLTKKQTDKIKVNGIQKVDLNKLVDGKETLAQRLDLKDYDSMYVIYSDKVDDISSKEKRNNTTYSLVGTKKDGTSKVLNDEFEMDSTVGNNASREQTKVRADSTATRDNKDQSVYTRKSNGASIGCENDMGNVNVFLYQKTKEENENVGIQVETSKTRVIPVETKKVFNRNKGVYQNDQIQNEIEEHTENNCKPEDVKDFDGDERSGTHEHINVDYYVQYILNYENNDGEQSIKEVFTEKEVRDKLLKELRENKNKLSIEQLVENVIQEMDEDAQIYTREHKLK